MVSLGPKRGWATPRMVSFSFRGLIHNFLRASPPISYGSPPLPPGIDQPGGQDGWILAEFFDLFYYQIYQFIDFILYLCLFFYVPCINTQEKKDDNIQLFWPNKSKGFIVWPVKIVHSGQNENSRAGRIWNTSYPIRTQDLAPNLARSCNQPYKYAE